MRTAVKLVGWALMVALALVMAAFAIHNYHRVTLDLWPLPFAEVRVALFILVLAAALIGFLAGGIVAWFGGRSVRRLARLRGRALHATRRELDETRAKLPAPTARH